MSSLGIFNKETKTYQKVAGTAEAAVVDAEMSDTSTNTAQNKVIKKYVDDSNTKKLDKTSVVNNNLTSEEGYALDARQANPNVDGSLGAQIKAVNETVNTLKSGKQYEGILNTMELLDVPYYPIYGCAVTINREIHVIGGSGSTSNTHRIFDGTQWKNSNAPYNFTAGSAVVLNGEIHILGGDSDSSNRLRHRIYNPTTKTWSNGTTLPYSFYAGSAVVLNGEIHILGGVDGETNHYKLVDSKWVKDVSLPLSFDYSSAVVLNNEIHIIGYVFHYKYDGTKWTKLSEPPIFTYRATIAAVVNNEIYIFYSNSSSILVYKFDGNSWIQLMDNKSYGIDCSCPITVMDNYIFILGAWTSDNTSVKNKFIMYNTTFNRFQTEHLTVSYYLPKSTTIIGDKYATTCINGDFSETDEGYIVNKTSMVEFSADAPYVLS